MVHLEEDDGVEFLVKEKGLLDALDDVLAGADRAKVLNELFPNFLLIEHFMNKF
jgi:hypothetical protein